LNVFRKERNVKKYEFGNKAASLYTENTEVIIGALSFRKPYGGHILSQVLEQHKRLTGITAKTVIGDRGYREGAEINRKRVQIAKPFNDKVLSKYRQRKIRMAFRRRAAIEPVIGHVKSDHRLSRNFYKGRLW
jgi:IS5 family transposase